VKEERGRGFFDEGVAWLARGDYREGGRSGRADDDFRLFLVVETCQFLRFRINQD